MESRLKKSHRLIRLVSDIKSAPYLTVEQLLVSHGISRAQFYKDKSSLRELGFEFFWDRHRRVVLSYRKSSANQPQREDLDPYHPFFQDRSLYVEGYACRQKDIRMFRLNRIQDIAFTPIQFTIQEDYSFGQRYRNAFSVFAGKTTEKVVVRFALRIRTYIEETLWHHSQITTRNDDGSLRFEVHVAEPREVMWWAFRWGAGAEIMEPDWLREEAKGEVEKMVMVYGEKMKPRRKEMNKCNE